MISIVRLCGFVRAVVDEDFASDGQLQFAASVVVPFFTQERVADAIGRSMYVQAQGNDSPDKSAGNLALMGGNNQGGGPSGYATLVHGDGNELRVLEDSLQIFQTSEPVAPLTGSIKPYMDTVDGIFKYKKSTGEIVFL